ncbi:MAG TPA: hypothetical protein VIW03_04420, partial [Anaeromyxobacter sp.]
LLVEALWTRTEVSSREGVARAHGFLVTPGFRTAFDFPSGPQAVTGLGVPLGVGPSAGSGAVLGYLGFELPFSEAGTRDAPGGPVRPPLPVRPATGRSEDGKPEDAVVTAR